MSPKIVYYYIYYNFLLLQFFSKYLLVNCKIVDLFAEPFYPFLFTGTVIQIFLKVLYHICVLWNIFIIQELFKIYLTMSQQLNTRNLRSKQKKLINEKVVMPTYNSAKKVVIENVVKKKNVVKDNIRNSKLRNILERINFILKEIRNWFSWVNSKDIFERFTYIKEKGCYR